MDISLCPSKHFEKPHLQLFLSTDPGLHEIHSFLKQASSSEKRSRLDLWIILNKQHIVMKETSAGQVLSFANVIYK